VPAQGGAGVGEVGHCGADRPGHVEPGALGVRGGAAAAAAQPDRPRQLVHQEVPLRLETLDQQLADRYRTAHAQYRAALADAAEVATPAETQRIIAAEHDVQLILQQIRAIPGFERFLQPMTVADIREAGEGHPVIYLISAPAGSYVLTVSPSRSGIAGVDAVSVPGITSTDVARLVLFDWIGGAPGLLPAQSTDLLRRIRLLPVALERLGEMQPLAQPIADALIHSPGNAAIVIPTGLLGLIPLPAIPMPTDKGSVLDDIGEIHLAPSAGV
jgi:hypothetical protein